MPEIEPAVQLNEGFSEPGAAARPWAEVARVLSASEMVLLSTMRRDGRPHVTPLPAIWADGSMYFCVGSHEQTGQGVA
jgi:predicted pyridoxine 5'-phosphate oxidase superfamily flavin-nucleotide-binding protein